MGILRVKRNPAQPGSQQTVLKRVLKQGNLHVCGVCRKGYPNFIQANGCLVNCVAQLEKKIRVVAVKDPKTGAVINKCPICKRGYRDPKGAAACLAKCTQKSKAAVKPNPSLQGRPNSGENIPEQQALKTAPTNSPASEAGHQACNFAGEPSSSLTTQVEKIKEDQRHKFMRDGAKYVCKRCKTGYFTQDEVVACYDGPCAAPEKVIREKDGNEIGYTMESVSATLSTAKEDKEMFSRDGAKYVCRNCGAKYFTRDEVVACFEGHDGKVTSAAKKTQETRATEEQPDENTKEKKKASKMKELDDKKKFKRDGARYVCRECGERFFTKDEVVACYDGH